MRRKYGKYEKRPEAAHKKPAVKSTLRQTYLLSLLCIMLCVAMLLGTTFAWFTSEVTNTANQIYIGTLDVDLQLQQGGNWVSLKEQNAPKVFGDENTIRWEPGYTSLKTLQVVNKGDLAFKYELKFLNEADSLDANVAELFEVYVCNTTGKTVNPADFGAIKADTTNWTCVGTLADILQNNTSVFAGTMKDKDGTQTYAIALHMKETATAGETGASIMGKSLKLTVKLIAYQLPAEQDSFGQDYDKAVNAVSNTTDLCRELNGSGKALMVTDIAINDINDRVTLDGGTLYGNGNTLSYNGGRNASSGSVGVLTTTGGFVEKLTIKGGADGRALYITNLESDLYVTDCTLSGAYSFNLNSATQTSYTINFTNTVFKNWTSYSNVVSGANFTDCVFEGVLRAYGDAVLTGCTFSEETLDVSKLEAGEKIILSDCVYKGVTIESATITATAGENGTVTVTCDNASLTVSSGKIVLN